MANADDIRTDGDGFPSIGGIKDGIDGLKALAPKIEAMAERLDGLIAVAQEQTESIHRALGKLDGMAGDLYRAAAAGEAWDVSKLADILKDCEHLCRDLEPSAWSVAGEYTMKFLNPDRPGVSVNAADDPVAGKMATALEAYAVVSNLKGLLADGIPEETVTKAIHTLDEATGFVTLCREARACLDRLSGSDVQVLPMDIEADLHNDLMCESEILHGRSRLYGREQGDSERHGMMPAIEESAVLLALGRLTTTAAALAYVAHVTGEVPTEVGFLPSEDPVFPALPVELVRQAIEESLPRAQALLLAIAAERNTEAPENLGRLAKMLNAHIDSNGDLVTLQEMFEAVEAHVPVSIDNLAEFARPDYSTVDMGQGSVWCEAGARVGDGYTAGAIVLEDGRFSAKPWHEACGRGFELAPETVIGVLSLPCDGGVADLPWDEAVRRCFEGTDRTMVAIGEEGGCLLASAEAGGAFPVYRDDGLHDAFAERYVVVLDSMVGDLYRAVAAGEEWDAVALSEIIDAYHGIFGNHDRAREYEAQYAFKFLRPDVFGFVLNAPDDPVAARMAKARDAYVEFSILFTGADIDDYSYEIAEALDTLRDAGQSDIPGLLANYTSNDPKFWGAVGPFLEDGIEEACVAKHLGGVMILDIDGSFRVAECIHYLAFVDPEEVGVTPGEMTRLRDEMGVMAVSRSGMALVAERGNVGQITGWTVKDVLEMKAELAPRRNVAAKCIAEAVRDAVRSVPAAAPAREAEAGRRSGGLKL